MKKSYKLLMGAICILPFALEAKIQEGFYGNVGIDGGWMMGRARFNTLSNGVDFEKTDLAPTGGTFGVFLGGRYVTDFGMFAGLDLTGSWGSASTKAQNYAVPETISYKHKEAYGFNVKLGPALETVMPFVSLGYSRAKIRGEVSSPVTALGYGKKESWESGFTAGLGADFCLTDGLFLGGVFQHSWYSNFNFDTNATTPTNVKIKPESDEIRVRLTYVF